MRKRGTRLISSCCLLGKELQARRYERNSIRIDFIVAPLDYLLFTRGKCAPGSSEARTSLTNAFSSVAARICGGLNAASMILL